MIKSPIDLSMTVHKQLDKAVHVQEKIVPVRLQDRLAMHVDMIDNMIDKNEVVWEKYTR